MAQPTAPGENEVSQHGDILLFNAETYLDEGQYAVAVPILQEILAEDPDRVDVLEVLARAYRLWLMAEPEAPDSLFRSAEHVYGRILRLDPRNDTALDGVRALSARWNGEAASWLTDARARDLWSKAESLREKDPRAAAGLYRGVIERAPGAAPAYARLARALEDSGADSAAVRAAWKEALSLNPGDDEVQTALARMDLAAGSVASAEAHLRTAFELNEENVAARTLLAALEDSLVSAGAAGPPDPERLYYVGRLKLTDQKFPEAVSYLRRAALLDSTDSGFRKFLGIAYYMNHQLVEALQTMRAAQEEEPDDPETAFYLGSLFFDLEHYDLAVRELLPVARLHRTHGEAARMLGVALTRVDSHGESAIFYLEQARQEGSRDPALPCLLGEQYLKLGRWKEARENFEACEKSMPGQPAGQLGLGLVADHEGKRDEAIRRLEDYLANNEHAPAVLLRLGMAYLAEGQTDSATARFREAIMADTTLAGLAPGKLTGPQVLEVTFLILMAGRNWDDGILLGEHLVQKTPDNASYANNLAMAYADADRDLDRALELAQTANRQVPRDSGFMDTLGWVLARMKRYDQAQKTLEESLTLADAQGDTNLSEVYFHLGVLYAGQNNSDEARKYLQMSLQNPTDPWVVQSAQELLEKLAGDKKEERP